MKNFQPQNNNGQPLKGAKLAWHLYRQHLELSELGAEASQLEREIQQQQRSQLQKNPIFRAWQCLLVGIFFSSLCGLLALFSQPEQILVSAILGFILGTSGAGLRFWYF